MPISHVVDTERRLLTFAVTGTLSTAEMLAAVDEAVAGVGAGRYRVLSDHRGLDTPSTTPQLEALVGHLLKYRAIFAGSRWAVVVVKPASFGMMRMLSVLAERIPMKVEVFTDPASAMSWLESPAGDR